MIRPLAALVALALGASSLVACSSGTDADNAGGDAAATTEAAASGDYVVPRTFPEGKGSGEADGVFPRTVTHFAGETTIEKAPERIVVIATGQADAVLTLGMVPVASTKGKGADMVPQYLLDEFPEHADELKNMADVGSRLDPDVESVANAKPDLILMNNSGDGAAEEYAAMSAIAPTVVTQGTGLYWKQDFLLLADALGKTEQAQQWLDEYHADAAKVGEGVDGNPTVSFLRKNGDRTRVFGLASFPGSLAEDAGLARPESQQFEKTSEDISAEQLDNADADWVFYAVQGGDASELTGMPLWKTLGAVSEGRAVQVDDDPFYLNAGPTAARVAMRAIADAIR